MTAPSPREPFRQLIFVAVVVTIVVAVRLFQVALRTGNYEGMWFSLAHTVIVALGVILVCRPRSST